MAEELSSHHCGFGIALRMGALGTFFISLMLCLLNLVSKHVAAWLTQSEKPANKQYGNLQLWHYRVSLFPQLLPWRRGNDRLCHVSSLTVVGEDIINHLN